MHLNLAQGFLKMGEYRQVLDYAGRALAYDAQSVKALYRTCLAYKELNHYGECRQWIARLQAVEPDSASARQLLQEVDRGEKAALRTEKKAASKIVPPVPEDPAGACHVLPAPEDFVGDAAVDKLMKLLSDTFGDQSFTEADIRKQLPQLGDPEELLEVMIDDGWAASYDMITFTLL